MVAIPLGGSVTKLGGEKYDELLGTVPIALTEPVECILKEFVEQPIN